MTRLFRYTLTLAALMLAMCAAARSVRISIQPSGFTPGPGDTFYLRIDLKDMFDIPDPVFSMPGCKVLFPLAPRDMRPPSSASYAVTLRAETPGNYSFGPISVGGVKSNKISYRIGSKGSQSSQPSPSQSSQAAPSLTSSDDGKLFLRATVSNSSPYEQQAVEYVVRLYTSYTAIFDWTAAASPKFGNCTYDASDAVSRSLSLTEYQGKAYESAVIARYIIYPTQPGIAKILGNLYTGSVAQRFTYNDPYYGSMSRVQPKQIEARPNDIELNVRPLPAHDGVVSGVGDFKVSAQLVSKQFKAHQAATVRYTISGTGNLGYLSLPDLKEVYPSEIKFLKSDDTVKKQVGASTVSGTVTFDCIIIPQREGEFELPPVKFLFFNPEKGSYYTLTAQGFHLSVAPGSNSKAIDESLSFNDAWLPVGDLSFTHRLFISSPLIWLWYVIPVLAVVVLLILYRKRLASLADVVGTRKRKAGVMARRRLRKAREYMKRKDAPHFYEEMLRAIWGYLSDKLSMPTSELSRENVSERLAEAGVSQATIDKAISLLDECEFAKYASASEANLTGDYDKGCELIDSVEQELQDKNNKTGITRQE